MRPADIFDTLPPHCQELVCEVEGACGFDIEVLSYAAFREQATEPIFGDISVGVPGAVADVDKAFILYPGEANSLAPDDYHHELLHLKLKLVRGEPALVTLDPKFSQFAAHIDNQADHMVIYADQFRHSLEWRRREEETLRRFWGKFPPAGVEPDLVLFDAIHRYFLTRQYAPELTKMAKRRLRETGHLQVAHQGWQRLKDAFPDKVLLVRLCLEFSNEPLDRYRLRELDLQAHTRRETAL